MEGEEKDEIQKKEENKPKKKADCKKLGCFGSQMECGDGVGEELNEEMDKWCENRGGWVNDRVKENIAQRRSENRE